MIQAASVTLPLFFFLVILFSGTELQEIQRNMPGVILDTKHSRVSGVMLVNWPSQLLWKDQQVACCWETH